MVVAGLLIAPKLCRLFRKRVPDSAPAQNQRDAGLRSHIIMCSAASAAFHDYWNMHRTRIKPVLAHVLKVEQKEGSSRCPLETRN